MVGFRFEDATVHKHTESFPDLPAFLALLEEHWSDADEIVVARAPGRLDVMGGIADYSGSLVMQLPIGEACFAAVRLQSLPRVQVTSFRPSGFVTKWECSVDALNKLTNYEDAHPLFQIHRWAGYIVGCLVVLRLEGFLKTPVPGIKLLLSSAVPEGKGVASSAAVEVATMKALIASLDLPIHDSKLAELAQRVENRVAGASCGIMDQMTAARGQKDKLMKLLCRPCILLGHVAIPPHLSIAGIDSGHRHSITGSSYTSVRIGAFMGRKILRDTFDWSLDYLAEMTPEQLSVVLYRLPETIKGSEFLNEYGTHSDPQTKIDRVKWYNVQRPTMHPIFENRRVQEFSQYLEEAEDVDGRRLGKWMEASHNAYTHLGLDSPGTTQLSTLACDGSIEGIYGCKISGGGSGGTVCLLLSSSDASEALERLRVAYQSLRGTTTSPVIFSGSSDGSEGFGIVRIKNGSVRLFRG